MPGSQPRLAGTAGEIRGTEVEPRGSGQEATPLPWSEGRPKRAEAGLARPANSAAQSGCVAEAARICAAATAKAERPGKSGAEAAHARQTSREPAPHTFRQPRPGSSESSGRRSAVGEGRRGKGTAGASGALVPDRRMGKMVCGGCTYGRRRCRRLRCCRRRLETPHPSARSRETRSLGGAWGLGRPPPPSRRPSFLRLHQPSALPSASALLLQLERPANRAAAS